MPAGVCIAMSSRIDIIILAAGLSHRFGPEDKLLMDVNGQPLYSISLKAATSLKDEIYQRIVVARNPEIMKDAHEMGFTAVFNPLSEKGQSESIRLGINALASCSNASEGRGAVIFMNADQPFMNASVIRRLIACWKKKDMIIVPVANGHPASPCLFPRRFLPELMQLSGDAGGKKVYSKHPEETWFIGFDDTPDAELLFYDIDSPEDRSFIEKYLDRK